MENKYLTILSNGLRGLVEALVVSAGAGDAGKIVATGADGRLDESVMPVGVGADLTVCPAFENLVAGDFVHLFDDAGTLKARLADASFANAGKRAWGFVVDNVTAPANATVYHEGLNNELSGLTIGETYALSAVTPGKVVALSSISTTSGHIRQVLGVAVSATGIEVEIDDPVVM